MVISQRVRLGAALSCILLNPLVSAQHHHGGGDSNEQPEVPVVRVALAQTDLEPFIDPLPLPPVAEPVGTHYGRPLYEVEMRMVEQQMHRDLPPTPVFTYGGIWPGPTFDIPVNQEIYVRWRNELPEYYPDWLPVRINEHVPDKKVRTVVHLHGGVTPSASDGYPDKTWYPGESALYRYPNFDKYGGGSSLWYHDHAMGSTRLSVYSGLSGLYFLRNEELEKTLQLPAGEYEVPLVIQDRNVDEEGVLIYNGVCRNFAVVNGKIWPYLEVEPRRYRFRVLNANNFRILNLALSQDIPMHLIGVDSGFLDESVPLDELLLGPAERADLIIDFSAHAGETIELNNLASCFGPYFKGEAGDVPLPQLMQFRVREAVTSPDESAIPVRPAPVGGGFESKLSDDLVATADVIRDLTLDEKPGFLFLMENLPFHAPAVTRPKLGTSEVWNLVNLTAEMHPVHVHLISFKVIDRIPFREKGIEDYIRDRDLGALQDLETYLDMNAGQPAPATENGPKDVALAPNGYVTRIGMDWYGYAGDYIVHCHILDHEDNDMMRPIKVLGPDFAVEADLGSEWRRSAWFGTYFEGNYATFSPWIYHQQHGHLYVMEVHDADGEVMFWLYDQQLGWLWMRNQIYPYVYREETHSWLYYLPGSISPRWFYDFGTDGWLSRLRS